MNEVKSVPFRFGAECYTWFMNGSGRTHAGKLEHMIEVTARAGFTGIEPIHGWMGELADPARLRDVLQANGVELAAIALALPWNALEETAQERAEADKAIALLKQFPGALLCTVQLPTGRHDLETRRLNLVANVNTVSRRATDAGVPCSYHPNSPHSSTNRTAEDYAVILEKLDTRVTGWTPDVGHMAWRNGSTGDDEAVRVVDQPGAFQGLGWRAGVQFDGAGQGGFRGDHALVDRAALQRLGDL